jgi:hypothetical protein
MSSSNNLDSTDNLISIYEIPLDEHKISHIVHKRCAQLGCNVLIPISQSPHKCISCKENLCNKCWLKIQADNDIKLIKCNKCIWKN